jgi:hypothetical protein
MLAGNLLDLTGATDPDGDPIAIDTGRSGVRAFTNADGALYIRADGTYWSYSLAAANGAAFTVPITDGRGGSTSVTVTLDASSHPDPWLTGSAVATVDGIDVLAVEAGDAMRFKVTLTNSGTSTLTNVFVHDGTHSARGVNCTPELGPSDGATLAPGEHLTCFSAEYVVRLDDAEHGSLAFEIRGFANNSSNPMLLVAWVEVLAPPE